MLSRAASDHFRQNSVITERPELKEVRTHAKSKRVSVFRGFTVGCEGSQNRSAKKRFPDCGMSEIDKGLELPSGSTPPPKSPLSLDPWTSPLAP